MFADNDDYFYDFTEVIRFPECNVSFKNTRMLQSICLLPNNHLLLEGGLMDTIVEVYQIQAGAGDLSQPIHVIFTNCRGLSSIERSDTQIFMGFMCSLKQMNHVVQIYNYKYEMEAEIILDLSVTLFTDLTLCRNGSFLVGSHTEGCISVINLETRECEIVQEPFGPIENIWGVEVFGEVNDLTEPQMLFCPTSSGMYQCMLTAQGYFMYCMESYYEGVNVSNSVVINDDEMLLSLQSDDWNKLVILNLDTREEKVVIKPDPSIYFIDIIPIPSNPGDTPYFILHTGKGIQIVNTEKQKSYALASNMQTNFNVSRSL